jgi:hypothetical protein
VVDGFTFPVPAASTTHEATSLPLALSLLRRQQLVDIPPCTTLQNAHPASRHRTIKAVFLARPTFAATRFPLYGETF